MQTAPSRIGEHMQIFDILIDGLGYTVARIVLPLASFHRIHVEPLNSPGIGFNALGCRVDENRRIEIESTVAGFLGFLIFLLGVGGALLVVSMV